VFKRLLLWIPRKNGKTEFLAALGLLFWYVEGLYGGQGYVFARDEDQAQIPFRKMKAMIAFNAKMAAEVQPHAKSLWLKTKQALLELLSGAELGKHGKSPSVTIGDEMHEWRSREIEKTLQPGHRACACSRSSSTPPPPAARPTGPASSCGTSPRHPRRHAGRPGHPGGDLRRRGRRRLGRRGRLAPRQPLASALTLPLRAAPRGQAGEGNPRRRGHFRCYHLNQWVDELGPLAEHEEVGRLRPSATVWKRLPGDPILRGRKCFGAFDVSSTRDVTALTWVFPPTGG
jgi:phage terminase large subunit-like protein